MEEMGRKTGYRLCYKLTDFKADASTNLYANPYATESIGTLGTRISNRQGRSCFYVRRPLALSVIIPDSKCQNCLSALRICTGDVLCMGNQPSYDYKEYEYRTTVWCHAPDFIKGDTGTCPEATTCALDSQITPFRPKSPPLLPSNNTENTSQTESVESR